MPQVLLLNHPDDNLPLQGAKVGWVSKFGEFLELALGDANAGVTLDSEVPAGADLAAARQQAFDEADFVVAVVSINFFQKGTDYKTKFGQMRDAGKAHAILYLSDCPYENLGEIVCEILPTASDSLEFLEYESRELTRAANAIAKLVKTGASVAKPAATPEQTAAQHQQLRNALTKLNFEPQPKIFKRRTIQAAKATPAAFLLHGQLGDAATRWLLAKLKDCLVSEEIREMPIQATSLSSSIHFKRNGFLGGLGEHLSLSSGATYDELCNGLHQLATSQKSTIVIIVRGAKEMLQSTSLTVFQDFLDQFWKPLVARLEAEATSARVLLFFVADSSLNDVAHFAEFDSTHPAWQPVRLAAVDSFDENLLHDWLDVCDTELLKLPLKQPTELIKIDQRSDKIKAIIQDSQNGLPELVLQWLCAECDCDFQKILQSISLSA